MQQSTWPDLAPDLLRDITGRLRDAGDFFRFHAVCKSWHESHSRDPTPSLPPWLLAAPEKDSISLMFRCLFSKSSYPATLPPPTASRRIWLSCADPTAVRYLTIEHLRPSLHDALTGEVTQLPLFPDGQWEERQHSRGAIGGDGSTLLYSLSLLVVGNVTSAKFRAALLRPGDVEWTLIERTLDNPRCSSGGAYCAVYRGGRILVTAQTSLWHVVITLDGCDDVLVSMPGERSRHSQKFSYFLESRGELLWASVQVHMYDRSHVLSVCVHALVEETQWVKKDVHSLADRVLFLGWPNSFAVDASVLGGHGHGGYAYFVHHKSNVSPCEQYGVFRYNLVHNKVHFVERLLPQGWDDQKCIWFVPKPAMASIPEITNRSLEARDLNRQQQINAAPATNPRSVIHIERQDDPCFRVLVRHLPPTVRSSQLQVFFGNHGKVSSAEVIYYKKTKRSQGMGFVTMSTAHAHPDDVLDALSDLVLEGCKLEVSFVNEGRRRRRSFLTGAMRVHTAPSLCPC